MKWMLALSLSITYVLFELGLQLLLFVNFFWQPYLHVTFDIIENSGGNKTFHWGIYTVYYKCCIHDELILFTILVNAFISKPPITIASKTFIVTYKKEGNYCKTKYQLFNAWCLLKGHSYLNTYTAWKAFALGVSLVRIFLHSDWIRKDTPYLSVFSPNARKYGPEKLRIRTLFN